MTTINDLLRHSTFSAADSQRSGYSTIDRRETELLLAYALDKDRAHIKAHGKDTIDDRTTKKFLSLIKRRVNHEPIAYLTGSQPFYGRDFSVNKHTLIPRPETEMLVELVKQDFSRRSRTLEDAVGRSKDVIIDIGTGSGCLAVTLALECPSAMVIASDVSGEALKVARKNAKQLGANVTFVQDSLLGPKLKSNIEYRISNIASNKNSANESERIFSEADIRHSAKRTFDLIFVANLPYLPSTDKKTMMPDVAKFEPHKALFAGRDGSSLVVKLLEQIRYSAQRTFDIQRSGHSIFSAADIRYSIFLELDPRQTKKLASFARKLFPKHKVTIKSDLCGRERFLTIT
ncbi:MAG: peptide chain release factor N(5)-glutamine methyltransferase [Patescibacteria group bacterium]|nr:peptide chain release factor N(5)-glutamine methyltransferase [Patescibacteria group bacterium]